MTSEDCQPLKPVLPTITVTEAFMAYRVMFTRITTDQVTGLVQIWEAPSFM